MRAYAERSRPDSNRHGMSSFPTLGETRVQARERASLCGCCASGGGTRAAPTLASQVLGTLTTLSETIGDPSDPQPWRVYAVATS
jgi:hypothetical protein